MILQTYTLGAEQGDCLVQPQTLLHSQHDTRKEQQKRVELGEKLMSGLGTLHKSISRRDKSRARDPICRTIEASTAWALDMPQDQVSCLAIPFRNGALAEQKVASWVHESKRPVETLGNQVTENFINLLCRRGSDELKSSWAETTRLFASSHAGEDPESFKRTLEADVRDTIIEKISKPLWERVEPSLLKHLWWDAVSDRTPRSLYSYLRENLIGIPVLYSLAATAGAEDLFNRLEPVIENFDRFIPCVQLRVDIFDPTSKRTWLGLDLRA